MIFKEHADWDARLNARDGGEFDAAWSASHERVTSSCPPEGALVRQIREAAFKKVYQITQHADLAGYVSDDMGLIAQASDNKVDSEFIGHLWKRYLGGEFPH